MPDKRCPHCGLWNSEAALTCDCGFDFASGVVRLNNLPGEAARKERKSSSWMSIVSLVMGFMATWPYLLIASNYYTLFHQPLRARLAGWGLGFGFLCGVPFGLAGILLGFIGWRKSSKNKGNVACSIIGILSGVGGIIGHIWYFATCQFCQ